MNQIKKRNKACIICGKGTTFGNKVSHSNRKTRRTWQANLQKVRVISGDKAERVLVCTKCLKAGKVKKAL